MVAAAVVVLVLLAIIAFGGDSDDPGTELAALELLVEPEAGPPGTTIRVSGGPCPRPEGWSGGEIYFGLYDSRVDYETTDVPDKDEVPLDPSRSWRGQLTVPGDAEPGLFGVYANCWAQSPGGEWEELETYEDVEFLVE